MGVGTLLAHSLASLDQTKSGTGPAQQTWATIEPGNYGLNIQGEWTCNAAAGDDNGVACDCFSCAVVSC